jgi:hypothetical protein
MDATRPRRTRDRARQRWYARYRQQRFARFLGFSPSVPAASHAGFVGQTELLVFSVVQINLQLGLTPGPRFLPAGEKLLAGRMRRRAPTGKPSLTPSVSPRAEGDRWISPPRDFGSFSKTLSRNALAPDV